MSDCACHSPYAKDCLASRLGYEIPFGERFDAEECQCFCHAEEIEDDWQDYEIRPGDTSEEFIENLGGDAAGDSGRYGADQ